ncbi:MAG TPA: haloacid dehalogenase [Promineifilum sp.]|nr:haloacid dehalogenase [Promineifilum sp.]HRO91945.1 haloacid dehalogenase [Promineifilum sp.]HRQ12193.1 haloacid dehalogenase [Promineifilum sp.]
MKKTNEMDELDTTAETIRRYMEQVDGARDLAYKRSRSLIALCARTIRAIHREEWDAAEALLAEARIATDDLVGGVRDYPELYFAGYTQDAVKEFVEGNLVYAMVRGRPLPAPEDLGSEPNTWLNGLAEAASELRRRILDLLRHGETAEAERLLDAMDHIYSTLVTFDFADQITGGLRRRTDALRAVFERTNGDVANSYRSTQLEAALKSLELKLEKGEER